MKLMVLLVCLQFMSLLPAQAVVKDTSNVLPASVYLNVAYGTDMKQVMDIYLPANRSVNSTKILFLIHGGSWSQGDKNTFRSYVDSLKSRLPDYAFINVNYRLASTSQNKFPAQENDVNMAVSFVMKKTAEYHLSNQLVLLGASAGAHLALLQAYKYTDSVKVAAVISFFGPSDFNYMYNNPVFPQVPQLLELLLGGNPRENEAIYYSSSPINFVTPYSCPTLMFQGGRDPLVNPKQSELLKARLEKEGVTHRLIVYPEEGHGWRGGNLVDSFNRIADFLNENIR